MKKQLALAALTALIFTSAFGAETEAPKINPEAAAGTTEPAKVKYVDPNPWTHKTTRLNRAQLDKLLGHPGKLLFVDLRRPDEISKIGGFPIYLSVQAGDVEEGLAYIPRDRQIVTVSIRAHRAGVAGDILLAHGYKVAGAVGVKDYEDEGGSLNKVAIPAAKTAAPADVKK